MELLRTSPLGVSEGASFMAATRQALARIESRPVGKDLLTLISKRCQGIGSRGVPKTCRILFGQGTLYNRHGTPTPGRMAANGLDRTYAFPDADFSQPEDVVLLTMRMVFRVSRTVAGQPMPMAGPGLPAFVCYNPFISYDVIMMPKIGVPTPAFVAPAHELVHALHMLSGDQIEHADLEKGKMIEEARTVGAGKYADTRISENAIRREHGLPVRRYYAAPNDCDAAALA